LNGQAKTAERGKQRGHNPVPVINGNKINMPPKKKVAAKKKSTAKRSRGGRVQRAVPPVVPYVVGSVAEAPVVGPQIKYLLEMVVLRRMSRNEPVEHPEGWMTEVHRKLMLINVTTLRELILVAPMLNTSLRNAGQLGLHQRTMTDMMAELVHMIQWPGEPDPDPSESDEEST
jgi:hypothetical protein